MKKIITSIAIVTVVTFYLSACKKSDTQRTTTQTPLQKIQAKWQLQTYVYNDHYANMDHLTNLTGGANDYLDFRTDMKVYTYLFGSRDTSTYALSGDTKVVIDGTDIFDIKTLTNNSFIMYNKDNGSGTDYEEITFTMKK